MSVPWFYLWSDKLYDIILQDTVQGFALHSIQSEANTLSERAALIVDCLKKTSEPYILFSDSDIVVKPGLSEELSKLTDDMVFLEGPKGKLQTGFMYLKVSSDVIDFWNSVTNLEDNLQAFKGTWSKFSKKFVTTDTWDKTSDFYILQVIPTDLGREYNFAEKVFTMAQHLDFQKYMEYVPENIVPFIYKIQELLFLTHKEMKKN
jgi:hypothetical protein